jgi:thiamine biosynthesis protein ThiS
MKILINGEKKTIKEGITIKDLAKDLKIKAECSVIDHNGEILQKADWKFPLKNGDSIEIITLVGGG